MAKSVLFSGVSRSTGTIGAGFTRFFPVGSGNAQGWESIENRAQVKYRTSGTLSNMSVYVGSNTFTGSTTVRLRKNGSNGNQNLTIGAGATGRFVDLINTDSIATGDALCYQFVTPSVGEMVISSASVQYEVAGSETITRLVGNLGFNSANGNLRYLGLPTRYSDSLSTPHATESLQQHELKAATTFRNFHIFIATNSATASSTMRVRKNGSNANQVLTIGAGATGWFEDNTNTDSFAINDKFSISHQWGSGSGTIFYGQFALDSVSTIAKSEVTTANRFLTDLAANQTVYFKPFFNLHLTNTASDRVFPNYAMTASAMSCHVSTNNITASSTVTFFKNGSAGNQTITIGSGATGYFSDASNTDALIDTDGYAYRVVSGNGGGSQLRLQYINQVFEYPTGTTFTDSFTETVTTADSLVDDITFGASFTESVTPSDSLANALTFGTSFTETVTPADSVTGANGWTTFADGVSSTPGATITGLTNGTVYETRVFAVNSVGLSGASNVAEVTPGSGSTGLIPFGLMYIPQ